MTSKLNVEFWLSPNGGEQKETLDVFTDLGMDPQVWATMTEQQQQDWLAEECREWAHNFIDYGHNIKGKP